LTFDLLFYTIKNVNAWQIIWRDLKNWFHRKRIFAVDARAYRNLRLVAERQKRSPEEVASRLFEQAVLQQEDLSLSMRCWEQLSPRQKQITAYVCRGDSTREIAGHLNIAPTTVKSHVEIILRKFGVKNRVALRQILSPWDLSSYL
jgi:DNA-binding CsgD family transcriptional regulator